ncbi:MAG: 50S ribosomal protein L11 methyltransferase [Anaerolineae bacterium]|nr:50S ribosomal protein L11 methyltransferase [Anaerolineae bacterium]
MKTPNLTGFPSSSNPGWAFGTGTHPTTQVCLELLEGAFDFGQKTKDQNVLSVFSHRSSVIDIGCGSGILTIAARKLGAKNLLGVDIDPEAIDNAHQNAALNGVAGEIEWGVGSVREIQGGQFSFEKADLLLANILAHVIIRLLDQDMAELLNKNGVMILSGILAEQEDSVYAALARHRLEVKDRRQVGDWVGLSARFTE